MVTNKQPKDYKVNSPNKNIRVYKRSPRPTCIANAPRIGLQAKNSSIISKNSSTYSDKKYDSNKTEEKDFAVDKVQITTTSSDYHQSFPKSRRSTQVNPKTFQGYPQKVDSYHLKKASYYHVKNQYSRATTSSSKPNP